MTEEKLIQLERRIQSLQSRLGMAEALLANNPEHASPRIFIAKGDASDWAEQAVDGSDDLVDNTGGRYGAALIEDPDAYLLVECDVPGTGMSETRWVKVGGGGTNGIFPVVLAQDGGGNGGTTNGTRPTWTYTLKDYEDGTTVLLKADGSNATGLSPITNTRMPFMAGAATSGTAYRKADGTLVLVQAFEDYANFEDCT